MKKKILYLFLIIVACSFVSNSFTEIIAAIKSGDANKVAVYFGKTIDLTIPGHSKSLSKKQAEEILNNFFSQNVVKDFKVLHQSENTNSKYCIGNLITTSGTFRTTIYTKETGGVQLIQELRFEK